MTILSRYLLNHLIRSFLAVFLVLSLIVLGGQVINLLSWSLEQGLSLTSMLPLLLLKSLPAFDQIFSFSLLLAVVITFGGLAQSRESVVMSASGLSRWALLRVQFLFAFPIFVIALLNALVFAPYGTQAWFEGQASAGLQSKLKISNQELQVRDENALFVQSRRGDQLRGVMLRYAQDGQFYLLLADKGQDVLGNDGQRKLVLEQGVRYTENRTQSEMSWTQVVYFEQLSLDLTPDESLKITDRKARSDEKFSMDLATSGQRKDLVELAWRFVFPLSILLIGGLALLLIPINPRAGKFAFVPLSLVFYGLYFLLLVNVKSWLNNNDVSILWLFSPLGLMALVVIYLVYRHEKVVI
jgi:lipopolysaccharide export system permease protein